MYGISSDAEGSESSLPEYAINLKEISEKMSFDQKGKPVMLFEEVEAVCLYQPQNKNGLCPELQRPWKLPHLVKKETRPKIIHLKRCPYYRRYTPRWNKVVGKNNGGEYCYDNFGTVDRKKPFHPTMIICQL